MVCRAMSQIILAMKYSSSGRKDNESGPVNESDTTIGEILTTVHVEFVNSKFSFKFHLFLVTIFGLIDRARKRYRIICVGLIGIICIGAWI